jgi:folylpolyglutamate synthase
LIFNCTSGRSGLSLLGALTSSLSPDASEPPTSKQPFKHVIFCTNTTFASGSSKGGEHARPREVLLELRSLKISCLARLIPPPRVIPRRSRPTPSSPPPSSSSVPCEDLTSNAVDAKDLETLATQRELAAAWEELAATVVTDGTALKANVHVLGSIEEAIDVVRKEAAQENGREVQALVTGSLHLVGGVMAVADLPL